MFATKHVLFAITLFSVELVKNVYIYFLIYCFSHKFGLHYY